VGRSNRVAYAYFTYEPEKVLSTVAQKRLLALREFTELGSGFKLALRDLEIRGAGNILGAEQHGHIAAVGFEMYWRLLEEAVYELQGEGGITAARAAGGSGSQCLFTRQLRSFGPGQNAAYTKLLRPAAKEEEVTEVADDIIDRYGEPPQEVVSLLEVARLKALAREVGIAGLTQKGGNR
jgi:transcription-repair coupling factor (superfamily II helicase)